ncbi:HlyD family secretion protein [Fodinibius roseus]|uniref:HlyD family secretion protein n=1 Tax=Fodinibius roseus TaxID=1194090 RepID=A0A1M4X7C7_9BACT|nr:efflux RND transporter periplasmic adaptor subunit [Fodinibius roseus]SHE89293.1 HlyD family secretion protein [Fodinibius roseus]
MIESDEKVDQTKKTESGHRFIDPKEVEKTLGTGEDGGISTRKKMVYGLIVIAILLGISWGWNQFTETAPTTFVTEKVASGDITVIVSATGDLQAVHTVEIGSEISGLVKSVYVDYNDQVSAGELLAELDTDQLEAEVTQAQASLQASEASLRQALAALEEQQAKTDRAEILARQDLISLQEVEMAQASLATAESNVAAVRAEITAGRATLNMAETRLEKAFIRSPIDGIVLIRTIKSGQAVAASFQTPVLFTLAEDLRRMELHVDVDEADIGQVKEGQEANFKVDAYPDMTFSAVITKVYYAPRIEAGVVTYEAILSVDNSGMLLWPGMTASTDIVINEARDVTRVPNSALRFIPPGFEKNQGEDTSVWILENGEPVVVPVKTGIADDRHTEIVSGVESGTEVLVNIKREE